MIKIITGSNINNYLGKGYVEFPEIYFWCDDVLQIAEAFLIAGRTKNITIITKDAMLIEALDTIVDDGDGQIEFFLDDIHDIHIQEEIYPDELYILYNAIARGYRKIDRYRIRKQWSL